MKDMDDVGNCLDPGSRFLANNMFKLGLPLIKLHSSNSMGPMVWNGDRSCFVPKDLQFSWVQKLVFIQSRCIILGFKLKAVKPHEDNSIKFTKYSSPGSLSFPGGSSRKDPPANAGDMTDVFLTPGSGGCPGGAHGNLLPYSSAWRIPQKEEARGLWSMGSQRVRHDRATYHTHMYVKSLTSHRERANDKKIHWKKWSWTKYS